MDRKGLRASRRSAMAGAGLMALAVASGVHAQTASGGGPAGTTSLGEVVVTAQKRSENLQRTPVAIPAFTSQAISQANLAGPQQLQFNVPSMTFGQNSGYAYVTLRGVGSDVAASGAQSSVGTYIDGVYIGSETTAGVPSFDLQRIEVLRGPQGTLYGRNTTGGVINYITNPPSFDPGLAASVSYGNYNATSDNLQVTGPLLGDKVAGSLSLH